MKFSFVIPVYNTEPFLPRCLDSLRAQTDGDFEVVVVDDCSPGDCAEVVRPYADVVRYVRHTRNRSAFQARCTGIAAARGDYVVPVDPDDYLTPETLAKLRAAIGRDEPDMVSYWMDYDDGRRVYPHWCRHPAAAVTGVAALRELVEHRYFTGVASKAFRRSVLVAALEALAAPAETYVNTCDDFLMLVAALMKSERVAFLDYAGYRYFVNAASTSFSWKSRRGFLRAREQARVACALLDRMASRPEVSSEVRTLVSEAGKGIAQWLEQTHRESSWSFRLVRHLHRLLRMSSAKC